jgi:sugar/nucleoside kinase (ribokinase family)
MTSPRNVLVVGDAMIDRAWVVAAGAETSQAHGDVAPRKVIDPSLENTRPGGAALTAAFLATDDQRSVSLLAPCGRELELLLERARVTPLPGFVDASRQETIKFRVYADRGNDEPPALTHRFDLDVMAAPFTVPTGIPQPDFVVVADFQKGVVTQHLLAALVKDFGTVPWFVDSKNPAIVGYPLWKQLEQRPTLFANRDEFAALVAASLRDRGAPASNFSGRWNHIESLVLDAASKFHLTFPWWNLVVKVDIDGAAAFWTESGDEWTVAWARPPAVKDAAGIGAGDAFVAGWSDACSRGNAMEDRLVHATEAAYVWVKATEAKRGARAPWPEPPAAASPAAADAAPAPRPEIARRTAEPVKTRLKAKLAENSLDGLLARGEIRLADARGHCGDFLTLDPATGSHVRSFASEIRGYFRSPGIRRPLNCLVWAKPGSGKSFLVEEVAKEVGAKFTEINVATATSFADLKQRLTEQLSVDAERQLLMIDEFVAKVDGMPVFPALLVPLWSKIRTKKLAVVMVDSYSESVDSIGKFLDFLKGQRDHKGPDLVSRINGPQIELETPGPADRAVQVASHLRQLHKNSAFAIERGALRALVADPKTDHWSPRSIVYVIEALTPTNNVVRLKDLEKIGELCARMGIVLEQPNGGDPIKISDK